MLNIMLTDLVPIFVIMILGYVSGKKGEFNAANARSLNQFVLNYALPAGLFVSIVKADRAMLFSDIRLSLVSLGVIVGCYFWSYFSCLKFFKHSKAEASIAGLVGGAPTIGYLGFAVLEPIYGTSATVGLVVAVVAIVVNAVTIPLALCLLDPGRQSAAAAGNPPVKPSNALLNALKEPVCWSPILAVLIVLTGFRFPGSLDPVFNLIANANAGVAVFAAGITLSTNKFEFNAEVLYNSFVKLIFMPAGNACHRPSDGNERRKTANAGFVRRAAAGFFRHYHRQSFSDLRANGHFFARRQHLPVYGNCAFVDLAVPADCRIKNPLRSQKNTRPSTAGY